MAGSPWWWRWPRAVVGIPLHDYQRNRILAFINPAPTAPPGNRAKHERRGLGTAHRQGILAGHPDSVALAAGPVDGFSLCRVAEEWGFLGCMVVLLAYALLALWVIKIDARPAIDSASRCAWAWRPCSRGRLRSTSAWLTGLLPWSRHLALLSYGGSSALTVMLALGLVMNVSVRRFAY